MIYSTDYILHTKILFFNARVYLFCLYITSCYQSQTRFISIVGLIEIYKLIVSWDN